MKRTNNDKARSIRVCAVVAYPAVSVALVVVIALALTPFGTSQVMALDAPATPTETTSSSATVTDAPSPTATDLPSATTTTATTPPSPTTTDAAPSPTTTDSATLAPNLNPNPTPSPAPIPSLDSLIIPLAAAVVAPGGVSVDHHVLGRIEGPGVPATYLAVGDPVLDASQFQTFRVRFQLRNTGTDLTPIITTPRLEVSPEGGSGYEAVPETPEPGKPFHMAREWVNGTNGGTVQGPLEGTLADFLTAGELGDTEVVGHHSMSANPDLPISLAPASFTEQEFTVSVSIDAQFDTTYNFRITNNGAELASTDVTVSSIRLGGAPAVQLSPGQRQGVTVENPVPTSPVGVTYPLLTAPASIAAEVSAMASASAPSAALYPLESGSLSPAVVAPASVNAAVVGTDIPVVESSNMHGQCAACHRGHSAKAPDLTTESQQSTLCFTCHDSAGASTGAKNVKTPYDLQPLANDPEKREYYSHDVISSTPAAARPSACADCHNSHRAKATDSFQTADVAGNAAGWSASGRLAGVSGVSVVNDPTPGTSPAYTALDGVINPVTLEYQLCFKCHAGAENLLPPIPNKLSMDRLDKGVEFNPNNASFHPIEAAGTNTTAKMDLSLAGTSPYKLWNFTVNSTVRCLNCHASGSTPGVPPPPLPLPGDASLPLPGSSLAPHTSSNRGILLRNYRDRVLKSTNEAYSEGDFALCYVCHGEEPFKNSTGTGATDATNFSLHGKHLNLLAAKGDGTTDIDTAGAGQGNAICAECHFRIHSTTNKVGVVGGSRLVNFAPNVVKYVPDIGLPVAEPITWTPGATSGGSCTLTCHLHKHKNAPY